MKAAILKTKNERIKVEVDFSARAGDSVFAAQHNAAATINALSSAADGLKPTVYSTDVNQNAKKITVGIAGGETDTRYLLRVSVETTDEQTLEIVRFIDVIDVF